MDDNLSIYVCRNLRIHTKPSLDQVHLMREWEY